MSKKKYEPGRRIWSMDELVQLKVAFIFGKCRNRSFIISQQARTLDRELAAGRVYRAIPIGKFEQG